MIPDEAIEAAAEALVSSTLGDHSGTNWEDFFEAARKALNAAAPQLMAEAWSEGHWAGRSDPYCLDPNPYREAITAQDEMEAGKL